VNLPPEIATRVRVALDQEPGTLARAHGGILLFSTLGVTLVLRPDGVVLDLWPVEEPGDPTSDGQPRIASGSTELLGLVAGSKQYPWLSPLIPPRPQGALDCGSCQGRGTFPFEGMGGSAVTIYCSHCGAVGWSCSEAPSAQD
jgi:hypothetical protein